MGKDGYSPHATKLDLSLIHSKNEVIVFRPGVVNRTIQGDGEVFDKVSAVIWLLNNDLSTLNKDLETLRDLEQSGKLFIEK